jgi:hypothetical protein
LGFGPGLPTSSSNDDSSTIVSYVAASPGCLDRQRDWDLTFPDMDVLHVKRVLIVEKIKIYLRFE